MYAAMACDWDRPRLVLHALSLALSAGEDDFVGSALVPVDDVDDDVVDSGASDATACLCNAYNSSLSRLVGVRLGVQFFIWATLARKSDALTVAAVVIVGSFIAYWVTTEMN